MTHKIDTALIFAAGKGTRLQPLTDTKPKALVEVDGKPLILHVVEKLKKEGIEHIVINIHHFASQIVDYFHQNDNFGLDVQFSDETNKLLETGGGIVHAEPLLMHSSPFLIYNADILSNLNIQTFGHKISTDSLSTLVVSQRKTQRYFLFDDMMRLKGWVNIATGKVKTPYKDFDPSQYHKFAFAGIHAMSNNMFDIFRNVSIHPEHYPLYDERGEIIPGFDGPLPEAFSITDFYLRIASQHPIYGYVPSDFKLLDVGKHETLAQAHDFLADYIY